MPTEEELHAEIERLRAENENLKKPAARGQTSLKVSEKGALSVYGMGRFPVTLYKEQWLKLLGIADEIKAFIEANNDRLKAHRFSPPYGGNVHPPLTEESPTTRLKRLWRCVPAGRLTFNRAATRAVF